MSDDVFSGQKSYHDMLKRAQALDPVLTYVLCDLVVRIKVEKSKKDYHAYETEEVSTQLNSHKYTYYFYLSHMDVLTKEVFHDLTVRVSRCQDYSTLVVRPEFANWLKALKLTFDHENHFVTIPN